MVIIENIFLMHARFSLQRQVDEASGISRARLATSIIPLQELMLGRGSGYMMLVSSGRVRQSSEAILVGREVCFDIAYIIVTKLSTSLTRQHATINGNVLSIENQRTGEKIPALWYGVLFSCWSITTTLRAILY
jgi:hypothetical protein